MKNPFKPASLPKGEKTGLGMAGYDNPRENIDPHIKTKVIDTKEIVQNGVLYDLSTIGGGDNLGNHIATQTISGSKIILTSLTNGRIPYTNGSDALIDSVNLSFSGTILTDLIAMSTPILYGGAFGDDTLTLKSSTALGNTTDYIDFIVGGNSAPVSAMRIQHDKTINANGEISGSGLIMSETISGSDLVAYSTTSGSGVIAGSVFAGAWNDGPTYAVYSHKNFRTANSNTKYAFIQDSTGQSYFNSGGGNSLNFSIDGARKMVLNGVNFNFVIGGTYTPTAKLEVVGMISGASIMAKNGFTGTGAYTNFTISGGIIISAS